MGFGAPCSAFFRTTMDEKFIGIFIKQYHKLWSVRTGGFYGGI